MELDFLQLLLIGIVQGITEFLPISSSAHLIILPLLLGQEVHNIALDVAAHFGTLIAVLTHFRKDIKKMLEQGLRTYPWNLPDPHARMFWLIVFASIPVLTIAYLGHDYIVLHLRTPFIIAIATIGFGILLWWSDQQNKKHRTTSNLTYKDALWIGLAQACALIPGASRSGVVITAALMLGLSRAAAARFSLLLSIPVILAATCYELLLLSTKNNDIDITAFIIIFLTSWCLASITIKFFLKFVEKTGMLPYVIYRFLLGGLLFYFFA